MQPFAQVEQSVRLLYALVLASSALVFGLAAVSKISVDFLSFGFFYGVALLALVAACYLRYRGDRFLAPMLEIVAAGFLLLLPILVSTYLAMSLNMPLADGYLDGLDRALGFDWYAVVSWVDRSPLASGILLQSYAAFEKQLLAVPVILCLLHRNDRAAAFIAGYGILCFLSSFISIWHPALGTYAIYGYDQSHFQNINIHFGYHFLESFHAVREQNAFLLELGSASGILTFPSVHAGIAFLIIWAMWDVKLLRYPFLLLNLLMAFAAITHANHFLIDVVAGLGTAAVTVMFIEYAFLGTRARFLPTMPIKAI